MKRVKKIKLIKSKVSRLQISNKINGGSGTDDPKRSKQGGPMCAPDLTEGGVNC